MCRLRRNRAIAAILAATLAGCGFLAGVAARADVVREGTDPILRLDLPGHTAEIRALAFFPDSTRLVSGGRDKLAMVWNLGGQAVGDRLPGPAEADDAAEQRLTRDIARRRLRESVLRWQIARGTRGAIQALAVSAEERPLVAVAGSGAMGSTGEILLIDATDATLAAVLGGGEKQGHRASVAAVDFAADGAWLFSQDLEGRAFAWKRGDAWAAVELAGREAERYGPKRAAAAQRRPPMRPLAAVQGGVALPVLVSPDDAAQEVWHIDIVDPQDPNRRRRLATDHAGVVMALDASPDGRRLASADLAGNVFVWDLGAAEPRPTTFKVSPAAESLALAPDGLTVAIGIAKPAGGGAAPRLEVWDVKAAARRAARDMPAAVKALAFSPDGRRVAWSGGWDHEVLVAAPDAVAADVPARPQARGAARRLGGVGRRIGRIAFAAGQKDAAPTRIAIAAEQPDAPPPRGFETAFDLRGLAIAPVGDEAAWAPAAGSAGGWSIGRAEPQPQGREAWQLRRGGGAAGVIELTDWQGRLGPVDRCVSWLTRPGAADPWAVALGTDRGIFVYEVVAGGPSPLVRWYRGHEDGVRSLAVSPDMGWLASGGRDGMVMLWPVAGAGKGTPLFERFGLALRVENGRAVVESIDEAGPLAGRDVRVGDVIDKIRPGMPPDAPEISAGAAVIKALSECDWDAQFGFFTSRAGAAAEPFNRRPAWENVAALHVAANREWAFWSPRGYYAASANGDTLFGWLQNRGLDKLPRFFRAAQFRRRLERPDVMSRLLEAGSLGAALRGADRDVQESSAIVLPRLIASTPDVRITTPTALREAEGRTLKVAARVEIPAGVEIAAARAYASGVVAAGAPTLTVRPAAADAPLVHEYEWEVSLPAEKSHLVQVYVRTAAGSTEVGEVTVAAPAAAPVRPRKPRLHVLAAGVDRFLHAERLVEFKLDPLAYAVKDARTVRSRLVGGAGDLYEAAQGELLADDQVTQSGWSSALATLRAAAATGIQPDDVVVVFLAGHGLVDTRDGRGYSYLCHDADLVESGDACVPRGGVVTWKDLEPLANLPCRKIAIIDTCHSGALGPAARGTALREFQENMILVLAAAADDEQSFESETWGHGAFTRALLDVFAADSAAAADGVVSLDEVIDHVVETVPRMTREEDGGRGNAGPSRQHPTVSPAALVPYMSIPLSIVSAGSAAGR
jgi:WD40 repeat protein